jgi:hypothetical protein
MGGGAGAGAGAGSVINVLDSQEEEEDDEMARVEADVFEGAALAYYRDCARLLGGSPVLQAPLVVDVETGRDWGSMRPYERG